MKAEDSGYTGQRGERREKQNGGMKEESICFHPQPSGGELRSVSLRETASC